MLEQISSKIKNHEIFYKENFLHDIFTWDELEKLLNLRPYVNAKRLVICKPGLEFNWPGQDWLSDVNTFPPSLVNEIIQKYVCYLYDSSRVNVKVNSLCNEIENITGGSCDAHIFFAQSPENESFGIHFDTSHNLIVQIDGQSNMKVWDQSCKSELEKISMIKFNIPDPAISSIKPLIDVVMNPGDVVYVPKFYYHQAISLTKRLSISFPHIEVLNGKQDRSWITLK